MVKLKLAGLKMHCICCIFLKIHQEELVRSRGGEKQWKVACVYAFENIIKTNEGVDMQEISLFLFVLI